MDANVPSEKRELLERPNVSEVVNRLIDQQKMPGTIGRNFREDYVLPNEEESCSKSHERTLTRDAEKEIENNLDPVSGLEQWKAVKREIVREQVEFVEHVNQVFESSESNEQAIKILISQMTKSGRMRFIGRYQDVLNGHESSEEKWSILRSVAQESYVLSEHSKRAEIACDAQGLKNANDAAASLRPDMSGEDAVDTYGFQEWGRKKQALATILGSDEYSGCLDKLTGSAIEDQYNNFAEVEVSKQFYLDQVALICVQKGLVEDVKRLKERGVTIIPFREGERGDESGARIYIDKIGEDGFPLELEKEDIESVIKLLTAVSETSVGKYSAEDRSDMLSRSAKLFGDRNTLTDENLGNPSFIDRAGYVRQDDITRRKDLIAMPAQIDALINNPEPLYKKIAAQIFTQSRIEMESAKKTETFSLMYEAVNGDTKSQQKIVELVRQNRFPGSVDRITSVIQALPNDPDTGKPTPISREEFDTSIASLMMKREDEKLRTEEEVDKGIYPGYA
jgi:hypothetical protein